MPKWKSDAKEFTVSVIYRGQKGQFVSIPKPLIEFFNKPHKITFKIEGKRVIVKV